MRKAYIDNRFISEHRKSCDRKMSAQSDQKMIFERIKSHSQVSRNFFVILFFMIQACAIGLHDVSMIRGKSETCRRSLIR